MLPAVNPRINCFEPKANKIIIGMLEIVSARILAAKSVLNSLPIMLIARGTVYNESLLIITSGVN